MTATASKPFTAIPHELADIEKINGKVFTMNMVYTYSLIKGYQGNGLIAYFSQDMLKRRLGITTPTVVKLIRDMVSMGLINKTAQIRGKTCHYTVNPITPEMVGTVEPEAEQPIEAPQLAAAAPEVFEESNPTAEPVEASTAPDIEPTEAPTAPAQPVAVTLMTVYVDKVEQSDQADPQLRETAGIVPAVVAPAYPRGGIKEPSREWELDPAF